MTQLLNTYNRLPIAFTKGEGSWLIADNNQRYLDAIAGIAVVGLGHAHPNVCTAICEQANTLMHTSNIYQIPLQEALGSQLCDISGAEAAFLCNSGAEANEAALKIARLYGHQLGVEKPTIVVMDGAFHGRTLATLSASGSRKVQAGFEPLVSGFIRCPFNDIDALKTIINTNSSIVAVMVEPIQGEGGVRVADPDYLLQLREICNQQNWLLMLDEIQTGNGRTGKYFAYQHSTIMPDVLTTAKGLGNGFPIGACLAFEKAAPIFSPGNHGTTFGGNPLACRVGLSVINEINHTTFYQHVNAMSEQLMAALKNALQEETGVKNIRGQGLMIGIELDQPCGELVKMALDENLLINVTADKVIRLLPALTIQFEQIELLTKKLIPLVKQFLAKPV